MAGYLITPDDLRKFTSDVFIKVGLNEADAEGIADHLVLANLRGVDSHGVARIPFYLDGIKSGEVNVKPKITTLTDSGSIALIDGDYCLGQVAGKAATELAIKKASIYGIGAVGVKRTSHVGMLAYYGIMIANMRMNGLVVTNSPPFMAAWGGKRPVFGTNPLCISFPYGKADQIVLDMATSETAAFRIRSAAEKGESIPESWALDKEGNPTKDPRAALEGALLPFGGYKGYGLAVAIELLSSIIIGADWSSKVKMSFYTQGGFFVRALDIAHFRDYEGYLQDLEIVVHDIKTSGNQKSNNELFLPGEKESRLLKERTKSGIPIDNKLKDDLIRVSTELNVPIKL